MMRVSTPLMLRSEAIARRKTGVLSNALWHPCQQRVPLAKLGPCDEWRNLTLTGRPNLDFTCQQTFVDTTKVAFAKLGACPWARQSRDPRDRKTPITAADLL